MARRSGVILGSLLLGVLAASSTPTASPQEALRTGIERSFAPLDAFITGLGYRRDGNALNGTITMPGADYQEGRMTYRHPVTRIPVEIEIRRYTTEAKARERYAEAAQPPSPPGEVNRIRERREPPYGSLEERFFPEGTRVREMTAVGEPVTGRLHYRGNLTWNEAIPPAIDRDHPAKELGFSAHYYVTARDGATVLKLKWFFNQSSQETPPVPKDDIEEINAASPNHLEEPLSMARAFLGSAPAYSQRIVHRLTLEATPAELKADGESRSRIRARLTAIPENAAPDVEPRPTAGAVVDLSILAERGVTPGSLSKASVTTGADGTAEVSFTAPPLSALQDGAIRNAQIRARAAAFGAVDEANITFLTGEARVNVDPHYGSSPWAATGVVPADRRFPAGIEVHLVDENGRDKRGARVTFRLAGERPRGVLFGADKREAASVEAVTDERGLAGVHYAYTGETRLASAYREAIEITSPALPRPLKATVSVGIDLHLAKVLNMYEGRGTINAREAVPVKIAVRDAFHPTALNLEPVLTHWAGSDLALGVRLTAAPAGNVPDYMLERFSIRSSGRPSFNELVSTRYDATARETLLWMPEGFSPAGVPRLQPRTTGANYFRLEVGLAELNRGTAVADPNPANNQGTLNIPAGVPAEAGAIWFLEDPFGPHTPQARFFRFVLDLCQCGILLKPTEYFTYINRGDLAGMAQAVIADCAGKMTGYFKGALDDAVPDELVRKYAAVAMVENLIRAEYGWQSAMEINEERLAQLLMEKIGLSGMKLVVVEGVGAELKPRGSNTALRSVEGKLTDLEGAAAGGVSFRRGAVSIYLVPAGFEGEATGGTIRAIKP